MRVQKCGGPSATLEGGSPPGESAHHLGAFPSIEGTRCVSHNLFPETDTQEPRIPFVFTKFFSSNKTERGILWFPQ